MAIKLINGEYQTDENGNLIEVDGYEEIAQQALIRLIVPKGSFSYNKELGSELYSVDLNSCNDDMLYSIVCDALAPMYEIDVQSVSRKKSNQGDLLILEIQIKIQKKDIILSFTI